MAFPDDQIEALKVQIAAAITAGATSSASSSAIDGASLSSSEGSSTVDELLEQLKKLEDYKAKHSPFEVVSRGIPR